MNSTLKIILPTAVATLLLFAMCVKTDDYTGPCGDKKEWKTHKESVKIVKSSYNYADSTRTIVFEDTQGPNDICADEHADALFHINMKTGSYDIDWTGKAYWGGIYGDSKHMGITGAPASGTNNDIGSYFEIGLKQAYPSGAAAVSLQMTATFKTFGSDSLDRIIVYEDISTMEMTLDYRVFK